MVDQKRTLSELDYEPGALFELPAFDPKKSNASLVIRLEQAMRKQQKRITELETALHAEYIGYKDYGGGIVWCRNCGTEWPDEVSGANHEHHREHCPLFSAALAPEPEVAL